jgi:Ca-activated chloride channel family protein
MAGNRLGQVVKAANNFIEKLQPNDHISVVSFNDRAEVVIPSQSGHDLRRLQSRISTLQTQGGTEILQGLQAGLNEVQRNMRSNMVNHLILITDGRTYGDEEACLRLAEQSSSLGISISAVGIGEEWNETFVDQLAAKAGGTSFYADRTAEINKLLERRLTTISHCFADNVKLQFKSGVTSRLNYAFRLSPDLGALSLNSPLSLGTIPMETSLSVMLEFELDASQLQGGDLVLLEGEMRLNIPSRTIPAAKAKMQLSRPVMDIEEEEGPAQTLINAISKLSLYRIQEQARHDIDAGDLVGAAKKMRMLATQLLSSGHKSLAKTVLLAADEIKENGSFGEKHGKQIKYGTRALIS